MKHHFISGRDIVMFSFQSWDGAIGSNFKDMALELGKRNRILFVNRVLDIASLIRKRKDSYTINRLESVRTGKGELEKVSPSIWVYNPRTIAGSINSIPFSGLHDWLNKLNGRRLANHINKTIQELGFQDVLLINDNDFIRGFFLKEMVHCSEYIFYLRDFMLGVDFFKKHGARHERGVFRKADLVVANSEYLASYARRENRHSYYIGQGCDFSQLELSPNTTVPPDIANIPHPIVGYAGFITQWRIDIELIRHVAINCPQCQIVLVGPVDPYLDKSSLADLPNIHFLGGKAPEQLAAYIKEFDICINPQIKNEITRGNYPRKADEYLFLGKPLVATATEAMEMFAPYSFLCETNDDYVKHIRNILESPEKFNSEECQQARKEFAGSHTWEESVGLLGDVLDNYKKELVKI